MLPDDLTPEEASLTPEGRKFLGLDSDEDLSISDVDDTASYFAVIDGVAVQVVQMFVTPGTEKMIQAAITLANKVLENPRQDGVEAGSCVACEQFHGHADDCLLEAFRATKILADQKEG